MHTREKTTWILGASRTLFSLNLYTNLPIRLGLCSTTESSVTISSCDAELQIDGFEYLKENFPTGLTEFLEYMAKVGEQSVILCRCGYEA
nr:btb/poz and math domain-containing protein 1 [Quercus suber]